MLDINKIMNDPDLLDHDPQGNMYGLPRWSRERVGSQAQMEGLGDLSETQWRVIQALRGLYRRNGLGKNPRQLMRSLEQEFGIEVGRKALYQMFPQGPITQGSRLAGIPAPPHSSDPSFGWAA